MRDSKNAPNDQLRETIKGEVLFIGLPIVAVILAFFYEVAYASYYGIPYELISLDTTTVIIALSVVFVVVLPLLSPVVLLYFSGGTRHRLVALGLVCLLITIALIYWFYTQKLSLLAAILLLVFACVLLAFILFRPRDFSVPIRNAALRLEVTTYILITILIGGVVASSTIGDYVARTQSVYLTVTTSDSADGKAVVLRAYGTRLICANYEAEKKKIERTFFVLDATSSQQYRLRSKFIGHLEPAP